MSTLTEFFNKANNNKALQADLDAAFTGAVINVAAKHGISLKQSDFLNRRDISDQELSAVAGGAPNSSLAQLWLDMYENQIPISGS